MHMPEIADKDRLLLFMAGFSDLKRRIRSVGRKRALA
jgi:hypothetical protein